MYLWTLTLGLLSQVTSPPSRALQSRERMLESCYAPAIPLGTLMVSDSGSETGAASRAHAWPDAVSLTALSALISSYVPHQVRYSNVCAVRDEEAGSSNLPTPTSSQATPHRGMWPFLCRTAAKYSDAYEPSCRRGGEMTTLPDQVINRWHNRAEPGSGTGALSVPSGFRHQRERSHARPSGCRARPRRRTAARAVRRCSVRRDARRQPARWSPLPVPVSSTCSVRPSPSPRSVSVTRCRA